MDYVVTLISAPGVELTPAIADFAAAALVETDQATVGRPCWLASGAACDIPFDGIKPDVADEAIRQYLHDSVVDIVAQPTADRRKRLLVADMDSTMIDIECIDELADFAGLRAEVAAITDRAMRGELNFREALLQRAMMLKGLPESTLGEAFEQRLRLMPGAAVLIATMRAHNVYTALVSGGFTYFTSRVRDILGFHMDQANTLLIADGKLTGAVSEPVLDPSAKLAALEKLAGRLALRREQTLAVGDGANDIPMIQAAGIGVAFHAKPLVAAAAKARINHGDLTALLYMQGYTAAEFSCIAV